MVDVALYEAVFAVTESLLPEYDGYGVIRQRTGNLLPGLTPSNTYPCQEDKWVVIGGNADIGLQAAHAGDWASRSGEGPSLRRQCWPQQNIRSCSIR